MKYFSFLAIALFSATVAMAQSARIEQSFNKDWHFSLGDNADAKNVNFNDKAWRNVTLSHDWSVESDFTADAAMGNEGGYLPAGTGRSLRERTSMWRFILTIQRCAFT